MVRVCEPKPVTSVHADTRMPDAAHCVAGPGQEAEGTDKSLLMSLGSVNDEGHRATQWRTLLPCAQKRPKRVYSSGIHARSA
jgi:hypothetical protein